MSSDPTPAPDSLAPAPAPAAGKTGNTPSEARRPRKILPPQPEGEPSAQPGSLSSEQLRSLGAQLQALLGQSAPLPSSVAADEQPAKSDQPAAVTSKNRRFTAKSSAPAAAEGTVAVPPFGPDAATAADSATAPVKRAPVLASPDKPIEEAFTEQRRLRRQSENQRRRRNFFLIMAGAAVAAFLVGRWTAPSAPIQPAREQPTGLPAPRAIGLPPWPEPAIKRLGEILAMDHEGKVDDASKALTELHATAGNLPGLELYQGNLTARRLYFNDAHAGLGTATGVDLPPLLNAAGSDEVGFVYSRQRSFQSAIKFFSEAVACNPFEARYYYHWAEALRRRGRQEEAVDVFQQGLLRVRPVAEDSGLRGAMNFKLQLARLEAGQSDAVREQTAAGLQDPGQAGYWQLAAAAAALRDGRIPEGIDALQKARASLSADVYDTLASDYFFRPYVTQNGATAALPPNDPSHQKARTRRGDYFVDP